MTGSDVKHLQRLLRKAGMKPGPLDGVFGPRTAAACNHYKWRIGYAAGECHPFAGGLVVEYLSGKRKPTPRMRLRAAGRARAERAEREARSRRAKMRLRAL
ncbi:MAG: peptidoglycan-binding protein, partial [Lentisphaerae bacterium]|nr:peptidoglycan-binding protein [Lentisphaerota bacterium]